MDTDHADRDRVIVGIFRAGAAARGAAVNGAAYAAGVTGESPFVPA